jgi:hypothetical protein
MGKWTADRGEVYYDGHHRMACWVEGDSLQPDHTLAMLTADLFNAFEDKTGASFTPAGLLEEPQPRPLLAFLRLPVTGLPAGKGDLIEWAAALDDKETASA